MQDALELDSLRVFAALADSGSIAAAAAVLETSRPRIRRQLDQLEETLETTLFARTREGVELTPAGIDLLPHARQVLAGARLLVTRALSRQDPPAGRMRVGVQVGYQPINGILLDRLMRTRFPEGRVEYVIAERPVDLLPDRVDFAICLGEQSPSVPCIELRVAAIEQTLLASPAWVEENGAPATIDEAIAHLVAVWRGPGDRGRRLHLRDGTTRAVDPGLITPDETFLRVLASQGGGVVYAPSPGKGPLHAGATLVPLLSDEVGRLLTVRLVVPEVLAELPVMAALLKMLRQFLRDRDAG